MTRWLVLVLFLVAWVGSAQAQLASPFGMAANNRISSSLSERVWQRVNARTMMRAALRRHNYTDAQLEAMSADQLEAEFKKVTGGAAGNLKPRGQEAFPTATRFKSTGKREAQADIVRSLSSDAETQKALTELFDSIFKAFEDAAAKEGLKDDMAAAMAFFASAAFSLEGDGELSDEGSLKLVRAIQLAMDTPTMTELPDLEKQKFYEFMVVMGGYLLAAKDAVEGKDLEDLRDASRQVLQAYLKIDPTKVKLTNDGFVPR